MRLALVGIPVGLVLTAAGARFIRALLFGVTPLDLAAVLCATTLLGGTVMLATWIPARRAARVDPLQSMH